MRKQATRHNKGKLEWSLLHYKSLEPLIKVLMFGANKYSRDNWKLGQDPKKVLESLQRHVAALMDGETNDSESGLPHIGHVMANAMFYSYFTGEGKKHETKKRGRSKNSKRGK